MEFECRCEQCVRAHVGLGVGYSLGFDCENRTLNRFSLGKGVRVLGLLVRLVQVFL